jgi:hypothetical protein
MNLSINKIQLIFDRTPELNFIKLDDYDTMLDNFKTMYNNKTIPIYIKKIGDTIEYNSATVTIKSRMGSGTYNEAFICKDGNGEYIMKKSIISRAPADMKSTILFDALYENIKHIILYLIINKFIGNIKLFPKPYICGFYVEGGEYEHIIIMEKGDKTLGDYIMNINTPDMQLTESRRIILNIYNYLILINKLTSIQFKHNDLKFNNIVMASSKDPTPLLIDFGFCEFTLERISFISMERISFISMNTHTKGEELPFGYDSVLDIMQLISSFYFYEKRPGFFVDPANIFKFIQNNKSNILDTDNFVTFLNTLKLFGFYGRPKSNIFELFYISIDLSTVQSIIEENKLTCSFYIDPILLAYNIGLSYDDLKIMKYQNKYLKYKMKYFALKIKE